MINDIISYKKFYFIKAFSSIFCELKKVFLFILKIKKKKNWMKNYSNIVLK